MKPENLGTNEQLYFRFLGWSNGMRSVSSTSSLTPPEAMLLEEVFMGHLSENPLRVRDVIGMAHMGSPATLHKRLMRLRHFQLVAVQLKGKDRRTKYLVATPLALMHMEREGEAMQKAMSGTTYRIEEIANIETPGLPG